MGEDVVVGQEDPVGEPVVAHELPDSPPTAIGPRAIEFEERGTRSWMANQIGRGKPKQRLRLGPRDQWELVPAGPSLIREP